ncbi:hypothetical protein MFLO_07527 [Listeria floridensis FSL S10-1187]|uniref:Uncharacterized protein n=1 Tax=Listeria floridensis FSL S10-1187 TaxID=1265817 RepID=A0ABN0RFG7_9LIST|nr:hypothetical protein [Listeria floridensis]EUJ32022.1 hypothetical protein MFLO_07527 [Listeria floridensis FSL S10-1187]
MTTKKPFNPNVLLGAGLLFSVIFIIFWKSVSIDAVWITKLDHFFNQLIRSQLPAPITSFFKVYTNFGGTLLLFLFSAALFLFLLLKKGLANCSLGWPDSHPWRTCLPSNRQTYRIAAAAA